VLVGAGASLPYPLYSKWAAEYAKVDPTVRVNYQSVGSGAGIRQMGDGVVDFGATDEPLSKAERERSSAPLVHVPTTIGAVVLAFNLPGTHDLSLGGDLIADIFLGHVKRWNDPRIASANPGRQLPDEPIVVVHRADGSGTSAALTDFLSKSSAAWRDTVGAGTSPRFPVGVGAKGNEGVTALVKTTPLAIGYVELAYARQAGLPMAQVRNRAGKMIAPTVDALTKAATSADLSAVGTQDEPRAALVDAPDEAAYPITALSYVVVPRDGHDAAKSEALAKFLWWATHDGQKLAATLDFAPLTPALLERSERALRELRADGKPILR
jgi:phosphate transport system substrate-binding protein